MSNLVQAAEELEYVPKEELVRMMEQGDMKYPPYLVLSEIQRRTQLENMVMQPKPNTTVAQEVVSEFAQPQGLVGMPQGMSADISLPPSSQTVYEDRGIPASGLAAGGYLGGGKMEYTGPTVFDEEGNELEGLEAFKKSGGLKGLLSGIRMSMNEGGITGYNEGGTTQVNQGLIQSIRNRYTKPDGSFDTARAIYDGIDGTLLAAATAATLVPTPMTQVGGRVLTGLRGALPFIKNLKIPQFLKGPGKGFFRNPRTYGAGLLGANLLGANVENIFGSSDENAKPNPPVNAEGSGKFVIQDGEVSPPPNENTQTNNNISEIVRSQMGTFNLPSSASPPPTQEQRDREKEALIFSTLAKNIATATNLSGIGEGLADATALAVGKSASDRKEDAEFVKAQRADVVSEIQIISSLQDIGARIRSNDIKERQLGQQRAQLLFDLLQDPAMDLGEDKKAMYLKQLESFLSPSGRITSPSTGVGGISFTK